MGTVIGIIIGIYIAFALLGALFTFIGEVLKSVQTSWEGTKSKREKIGYAVGEPLNRSVTALQDYRIVTIGFVVSLFLASIMLGSVDSTWIINSLDSLGGQNLPLLGWAIVGLGLGIAMGLAARIREFGWLNNSSTIARVPDIKHLHAGEITAHKHFQIRQMVSLASFIFLLTILSISYWRTSDYNPQSHLENKVDAIKKASTIDNMTILNSALEDANSRLDSDPSGAIKLLIALQHASGAASPEVGRVNLAAQKYLTSFRADTEKMVAEGGQSALIRSEAFAEVNKVEALRWLAHLYENGNGGAKKDLLKSFAYLNDLSALDSNIAIKLQEKMAKKMLSEKDGAVKQVALHYFGLKAEQGNPTAQYILGEEYLNGSDPGATKNAEKWLSRSLAQDSDGVIKGKAFSLLSNAKTLGIESKNLLDTIAYKYVEGNNENFKKVAYDYIEQRANQGVPEAQFWMGFRLNVGDGLPKNTEKAREWFLKAALQDKNKSVKDRAFEELASYNHPPIQAEAPMETVDQNKSKLHTPPESYNSLKEESPNQEIGPVQSAEHVANYNTCIDGRYPSMCKHSLLNSEEAARVQSAEHVANYNTCIDGRYPSMCKHSLLNSEEAARVQSAEHVANYNTCIDGRYPSMCKHSLLNSEEAARVQSAEHVANYNTCIDGRYPSMCKHSLLNSEEAARVQSAERSNNVN